MLTSPAARRRADPPQEVWRSEALIACGTQAPGSAIKIRKCGKTGPVDAQGLKSPVPVWLKCFITLVGIVLFANVWFEDAACGAIAYVCQKGYAFAQTSPSASWKPKTGAGSSMHSSSTSRAERPVGLS